MPSNEKSTNSGQTYVARWSVIDAHCRDRRVSYRDVYTKTKPPIGKRTWSKMKNRNPVSIDVYKALADYFGVKPHNLYHLRPADCISTEAVDQFAHYLVDRINRGVIPREYKDAEGNTRRVDVIRYVWQMDDPDLSIIRLNIRELQQAFRLVVEWDHLEESTFGRHRYADIPCIVGDMHIMDLSLARMRYDLKVREFAEKAAIDYYVNNPQDLPAAIAKLEGRLTQYWQLHPKDAPFAVDIDEALKKDEHCRHAIIPTGVVDTGISAAYARSRYAIHKQCDRLREENPDNPDGAVQEWWQQRYEDNGTSLRDLLKALNPNFMPKDAKRAIRGNIRETEKLMKELFSNQTDHGPRAVPADASVII